MDTDTDADTGSDVDMPWIQMWIQIKTRAAGSGRTALVWGEVRDGNPDQTTVRSGSKGECGQLKKKKKKCMDLDRSYIWVGGEKFSGREKPVNGFEGWKEHDHSRKPMGGWTAERDGGGWHRRV